MVETRSGKQTSPSGPLNSRGEPSKSAITDKKLSRRSAPVRMQRADTEYMNGGDVYRENGNASDEGESSSNSDGADSGSNELYPSSKLDRAWRSYNSGEFPTTVSPAIRARTTPLPGSSPHDLRSTGSPRFASPQSTASPSNIGWAPRSAEKHQSPAPRGRDTTSPGTRQARASSRRGSVPESPAPHMRTRNQDNGGLDKNLVLVLVLAFCFLAAFLFMKGTPAAQVDTGRLKHRLEYVMKKHPELTEDDRLHIQVATEKWLDSSSREPVVVIMLLRRGSTLLDELVSATFESLSASAALISCSESTQRADLHRDMEEALHGARANHSTIGLRNIERLTWDAPLVLQAFADYEHPYPSKPLLWLSVEGESVRGSCDGALQKKLFSSWTRGGGDDDNVPPVISRVLGFSVCPN